MNAVKVGDYIVFGSYVQGKESDVKEDIEWLVLTKKGNKALVISKYALDCQIYSDAFSPYVWEFCSLRKWLNVTFISNAFSSDEQKMIQTTTLSPDDNRVYELFFPGNDTIDKVFLLNITEAEKYFSSDEARKCVPTEYAIAQGVRTNESDSVDGKATCLWWLRSPATVAGHDVTVNMKGLILEEHGSESHTRDIGVRPAMWINLGP